MFDANMCGLPLNTKFFAKVRSCEDDCELFNLGVRAGEIIQCEMLSSANENPTVLFKLSSGDVEMHENTEFGSSWITFEGRLNGSDFIN